MVLVCVIFDISEGLFLAVYLGMILVLAVFRRIYICALYSHKNHGHHSHMQAKCPPSSSISPPHSCTFLFVWEPNLVMLEGYSGLHSQVSLQAVLTGLYGVLELNLEELHTDKTLYSLYYHSSPSCMVKMLFVIYRNEK